MPSGGGGINSLTVKGENKEVIKENLEKQLREWREKGCLKDFIFAVERQIEVSKWVLGMNKIVPRFFGRKGMRKKKQIEFDNKVIEDNEEFLKFIKEEFNIELSDGDRYVFWQALEEAS